MSPTDRCDQIIRVIDDTLRDVPVRQTAPPALARPVATAGRRTVRGQRSGPWRATESASLVSATGYDGNLGPSALYLRPPAG
jgi:hypothetical protein